MTDPTARCVIGTRDHRAAYGLLACDHHVEQMAKMLREIESEAAILETLPSMAIGYDRSGGGLASHQSPARIDAIVLRDRRRGTGTPLTGEPDVWGWDETPSVLDVLHSWARIVREERNLASPDSVTVMGERDLLSRQLLWACEQPWLDEMHQELRDLLHALRRTNNTLVLPAGVCGTVYGLQQCDGKVWHIMIKHDGEPDEPGFRCGACRRVWTGTEAVRKRDDMWRDEQERKATA